MGLTLLLALSSGACNPFRRKKTPPPTPPAPAVQKPAPAPVAQPPAHEPAAQPPVPTPAPEQPPDTRTVRLPGPVAEPAKPAKSQPAPAASAQTPPPVVAPPVPQLGQILSPEEQQHYSRLTDEALGRTRGLLRQLDARRLTAEQKAAYDRILTFVRQAEQLRQRDLVQAASLAGRAAVLAADLAASVR